MYWKPRRNKAGQHHVMLVALDFAYLVRDHARVVVQVAQDAQVAVLAAVPIVIMIAILDVMEVVNFGAIVVMPRVQLLVIAHAHLLVQVIAMKIVLPDVRGNVLQTA
jgi:hypothetical protein